MPVIATGSVPGWSTITPSRSSAAQTVFSSTPSNKVQSEIDPPPPPPLTLSIAHQPRLTLGWSTSRSTARLTHLPLSEAVP